MTSYLLIDSSYRDRIQNPNPSNFIIPFQKIHTQVLNENVFTTTNPITNPYPGYNFQFPNFDGSGTFFGQIIGGTASAPVVDQSLNTMLGINPNDFIFTTVYRGIDCIKNLAFLYNGNFEDQFIIIAYDPVNRIITLDGSIIGFEVPSSYGIYNRSTNKKISVQGDFISSNSSFLYAYEQLSVYDLAIDELVSASYDNNNEELVLDAPFFGPGWRVTDPYILMGQDVVVNHGSILPFSNGSYYVYSINEHRLVEGGSGYRYNDILYAVPENQAPSTAATRFRILKILPAGELLEIEMTELGTIPYNKGMVCDLYRGDLVFKSAKIVVVSIGQGFRIQLKKTKINDMFGNFFFPILLSDQFIFEDEKIKMNPMFSLPTRITNLQNTNVFSNPTDIMSSFYANGVSGIYKMIYASEKEAYIIVQLFPLNKSGLFDRLPEIIPEGLQGCLNFMILPFSKEGVVGMNFTSTTLTQSQVSCYEISLINLIIPNLPLIVGPGPLTSALPYLFCELSNVSQGSNKSVLYSNNPYSTSVTFVCSISDVNNPIISKFLKISSDGTTQTIKFSPVDSLHFRIKLPDGSDFLTSLTDYLVPVPPDPRVQVNALFSIKRL